MVRETKHEVIEVGSPHRNMVLSYVLAFVKFHLELARLVKSCRFDCVILSNIFSPFLSLIVVGRPCIFDYKDVYPLSASVPYKTPMRQIVYWLTRFFERVLMIFPMTIVVPSPSMAPLIRNRFGISAVLIPNGVNTELFHPTFEDVRTRVRTDLGVRQDEFCLCYLGSIENWLDLESVVHALTQLKSMRLIMIGGPPRAALYLQSILTLCEKEGVRVTSTGFKSQAEAAKILSACDAAIIPFPLDRELSAVSLPDKTFEYLASGIPVISTKLPDVQKLFGDLVHFYSSTDELIEVLRRLQSHMNDEKCDPSEQIARAKNYDWKTISRSYENLISELVPVGAGSCPSQGGNQQSSATRIKLDRTSRRIARQDENSSCVSF